MKSIYELPGIREFVTAGNIYFKDKDVFNYLFDSDYYLSQIHGFERLKISMPFKHYLEEGIKNLKNPHPLFNTQYYLEKNIDVKHAGMNPLVHFVLHGHKEWREFHPLFDIDYYISQIPDLHEGKNINLLLHYLTEGYKLNISPSRLFDAEYYVSQYSSGKSISDPALLHYLKYGNKDGANPHPAFNTEYYLTQHPDRSTWLDTPPLLHFFKTAKDKRKSPHPLFNSDTLIKTYPKYKEVSYCPLMHYIQHGIKHNISPNQIISDTYILSQYPEEAFANNGTYYQYFRKLADKKGRFIFIGHEATRTGAPLILLGLIKRFAVYNELDSVLILNEGGPLVQEYRKYAHVVILRNQLKPVHIATGELPNDAEIEIGDILNSFSDLKPLTAIVNSANAFPIAYALALRGVPVYSLIHEMPQEYQENSKNRIYEYSRKIIFSANQVKDSWESDKLKVFNKSEVLPQGLLDNKIRGTDRKESRDTIRHELGLPDESVLIIGCGTVDLRKGIDYFVQIARQITKLENNNIHFIWIGKIIDIPETKRFMHYLHMESDILGKDNTVYFLGEREDIEPYLRAADIFILPSRADPFPCVVLEAMACELPVIAFDKAGGAVEAVGNDCGIIVPYGDVTGMVEAIRKLITDNKLREKMGQNARETIEKKYNFDVYFESIKKILPISLSNSRKVTTLKARKPEGKRIIFSNPDWSISGVNTFTVHLMRGLINRGYDVELVFTRGRFGTYLSDALDEIPDIPKRFLQPDNKRPQAIWKAVHNYLEANGPCIYIPNYDFIASAISPTLSDNVGIIGIAHSDDPMHYEHVYRLGHSWNKIVTVSNHILSEIVKLNQSLGDKIKCIHYGVPVREEPLKFKNKIDKNKKMSLIYTGRFIQYQKRIHDYVDLAWALYNEGIDYELVMVGDGEEYAKIRDKLMPLINEGVVVLTGRLGHEKMYKLYNRADMFLLLSDFEGLSLSLLESMERGCVPIVYEMDSGIPELIKNKDNGFIIPHNDINAVVSLINELSGNKELLREMGMKARDSIVREFSENLMIDRYVELIEDILGSMDGIYTRQGILPFKDKIAPPPQLIMRMQK